MLKNHNTVISTATNMATDDCDVLIIGAGISGIAMACYLQEQQPHKRFMIVEKRESLGGTWDIFRYPGVRSDSDMLTLGYGFAPWLQSSTLAKGEDIKQYLKQIAHKYDVQQHIRYGCMVTQLTWSSDSKQWTATIKNTQTKEVTQIIAKFVVGATGYYDTEQGYQPQFEDQQEFTGQIIHPQNWQDVDYDGKDVVVIGSGATAMTLVPALVDKTAEQCAHHVTMIQRSPTYVASIHGRDKLLEILDKCATALDKKQPYNKHNKPLYKKRLYELMRWRNLLLQQGIYQFATRAPKAMKAILTHKVKQALKGSDVSLKHFSPSYDPWDERLCAVPDDDLFQALQSGSADVVTGQIKRFSASAVVMQDGQEIAADIIVTATGLKLQMLGGAKVCVDDTFIDVGDCLTYKAVMIGDVPNMAILFGYTNASWTLKIELACQYLMRLFDYMDKQNVQVVVAKTEANYQHQKNDNKKTRVHKLTETVMGSLSAGYIKRAQDDLPKQGDCYPWRVEHNYLKDRRMLLKDSIEDEWLVFA
ncbi:flavin-containing monooxygenase [Psychrobacter sp. I-STPA10]|uniref:flavin-containing monooxygenase n=1 Tax=Psychrobacter sp. I-STPA10 TaxID=2585769 RepID=UPI001E651F5F|nr:NAD(P)/FAD-dependent oxidoreductase [Psychrobacter sp. I-STPA10]